MTIEVKHQLAMSEQENFFKEKIDKLRGEKLFRKICETVRVDNVHIMRDGKKLLSFSNNDYLALAGRGEVKNAALEAIKTHGVGASASRLITGSSELHNQLEQEVAKTYSKQTACVFSSGYAANLGAIPSIVGKGDLVIADKLSHSCLIEAAKLSESTLKRFKHNDLNSLEKIITENRNEYKNCLIITESVFSMDGDEADIASIIKLAKKYNCWSYVDYAHDIKTFFNESHSEIKPSTSFPRKQKSNLEPTQPDFIMGTFSKALGSLGGYVAASEAAISYIKSTAKTLIYSTALPASVLAASLQALKLAKSEKDLAEKALKNAEYFRGEMKSYNSGVNLGDSSTQIVPVIIGDSAKTLDISSKLEAAGILVHGIRTPTVPKNEARLRISFSAAHSKENIDKLISELKKLL